MGTLGTQGPAIAPQPLHDGLIQQGHAEHSAHDPGFPLRLQMVLEPLVALDGDTGTGLAADVERHTVGLLVVDGSQNALVGGYLSHVRQYLSLPALGA